MGPMIKKKRVTEEEDEQDGYSSDSNHGSSEASGSDAGRVYAKVNRVTLDKNSDEYRKRRERNNQAVKKSRNKSKIRTMQTLARVNELKKENEDLNQKIQILSKELTLLKELFRAHVTGSHGSEINEDNLRNLFSPETYQELMSSKY